MKILFLRVPCALFFFCCQSIQAEETAKNPVPVDAARESFKLAADQATSVDMISVPEGFKVELVRSANGEEGSWISLAFDGNNQIFVGKEDRGVLRFTLDGNGQLINSVLVNDDIEQCRGVLWAHNSLYLNSNPYADPASKTPPPKEIKPNSHGLFRLQDLDGDGKFETRVKLLETYQEMPGHGRNQLRLGPDGLIYFMSGFDVKLTDKIDKKSFLKNFAEDQLIPNPWDDEAPSSKHGRAPGGHLIRMDKDGKFFQLIAGGFRNAMDIDFNRDGEIFTYDADMEWDAALAWYKPTRILHVVSGADFGWRRGTGKWPAYYEDSLPAALDIGLGSPTGVEFGHRSSFPGKWKDMCFAGDWTYGRIIAVNLAEKGSSYVGSSETFASGRPMNVVDLTFGPDGHLYFVTGGMKTKSGIYRIRWAGNEAQAAAASETALTARTDESEEKKLRNLRYQIEFFQVLQSEKGANLALENIGHPDDFVRHAARVALENQDPALWAEKALATDSPAAMLALARTGNLKKGQLLNRMNQLDFKAMNEKQLLGHLRALQVEFARNGRPDSAAAASLAGKLSPLFPHQSTHVNHELTELLVYLDAPKVLDQLISLIQSSKTTEDLSHYLVYARYLKNGWGLESKRGFLKGVQRLETFPGGKLHQTVVDYLRNEMVAQLTEPEKMALAKWIAPVPVDVPVIDVGERTLVKDWKIQDFDQVITGPLTGRTFENGLKAYTKSNCVLCHLMQGNEASKKGIVGPDLTHVGGRFGLRDLLVSIIDPSLAINDKYRNPAAPNISTMPPGQLNFLNQDEVLDLLAYLQSGGQKDDKVFRGPRKVSSSEKTMARAETKTPVSLTEPDDPQGGVVIAPSYFEKMSASNEADRERIFGEMKKILATHPAATFELVGHADDSPYEKTNFDIGMNRAKFAAQNLSFRGIPKAALSFRSEGSKVPSTAGNRRVEIIVSLSGKADAKVQKGQ